MKRDDHLQNMLLANELKPARLTGSVSFPLLKAGKFRPRSSRHPFSPMRSIESTSHLSPDDLGKAAAEGDLFVIITNIQQACAAKLKRGRNVLHMAAENGQTEVVRVLLHADPSLPLRNSHVTATPLQLAIDNGHEGVAQLIRGRPEKTTHRPRSGRKRNKLFDPVKWQVSVKTLEAMDLPETAMICLKRVIRISGQPCLMRVNVYDDDSFNGVVVNVLDVTDENASYGLILPLRLGPLLVPKEVSAAVGSCRWNSQLQRLLDKLCLDMGGSGGRGGNGKGLCLSDHKPGRGRPVSGRFDPTAYARGRQDLIDAARRVPPNLQPPETDTKQAPLPRPDMAPSATGGADEDTSGRVTICSPAGGGSRPLFATRPLSASLLGLGSLPRMQNLGNSKGTASKGGIGGMGGKSGMGSTGSSQGGSTRRVRAKKFDPTSYEKSRRGKLEKLLSRPGRLPAFGGRAERKRFTIVGDNEQYCVQHLESGYVSSPGPGAYSSKDPSRRECGEVVGGGWSLHRTPTAIEQAIRLTRDNPGVGQHSPSTKLTIASVKGQKISDHYVKSDLELQIDRAKKLPGPGENQPAGGFSTLTTSGGKISKTSQLGLIDATLLNKKGNPAPGQFQPKGGFSTLKQSGGKISKSSQLGLIDATLLSKKDNPAPGQFQPKGGFSTLASSGGRISKSSQMGLIDATLMSTRDSPAPGQNQVVDRNFDRDSMNSIYLAQQQQARGVVMIKSSVKVMQAASKFKMLTKKKKAGAGGGFAIGTLALQAKAET